MADSDQTMAVLMDADATARLCLAHVQVEPDRVLALHDSLLLVLDLLVQQQDQNMVQRTAMDVLHRILPLSVGVLHDARQLLQTTASQANPLLSALLAALRTLADRTDPAVPMEIVSGLVQLAHRVCLTSMTAADVVLLFEFLRVSRAPARHLVLQMQTSLLESETMPRAVFTMNGVHAGIIAPSTQMVFSKKGYTLSFGLLLEASASVVSMYSFRGSGGHGVSGMMEGSNLVLKMHSANGSTSQVVVPFGPWRSKMETTWVHVCIVHAKKMVFKDKVALFADGAPIFNGNLRYPDPLAMLGGQNCIGVIPTVSTGFQGRMWSPTLFGQPLSEADVQKLHWLTHWKSDLSSVAAENTGLSDKSKLIFSYDARSCDPEKRICFDVSGNDCHGWMEPGTKGFVTQGLRQAMDAVGGSACFLLLLLDQIPEMADFHPKQEMAQEEISDLLAFVGLGLRTSMACRAHFVRLRGVNVLAFIIQSVSPQYLTLKVLASVTEILESILKAVVTPDEASEYIQLLLFRNTNWFLSPFDTQVKLLGDVLPAYLKVLGDIWATQAHGQKTPGMAAAASAMEALGIVASSSAAGAMENLASNTRTIDVNFFCNLLVQVYAPRLSYNDDDEEQQDDCSGTNTNNTIRGRKTAKQMAMLRRLLIDNLIDRVLCPLIVDDDLYPWRQLLAHLHHRCAKLTAERFAQDGEGMEVKELLAYMTRLFKSNDSGNLQQPPHRQGMAAKICKLSNGTLRLWWHAMHCQVPEIRLEGLRLFEAYCTDKVTLKRRDAAMLVATHRAYPIDLATSDVLLDLVIGRKHTSYYGTTTPASAAVGSGASSTTSGSAGSGRSLNVARLEFVPMVLIGLAADADFTVQAHVLYEIKMLVASPNVGQTAVEAMRSWPPWLSRLQGIIRRAGEFTGQLVDDSDVAGSTMMSAQALNDACVFLSDENSPVTAKLDAIHAIGQARDFRGCDFALSLFQNADQPASVNKAIALTVQERFPTRCAALVIKIAKQLVVDVIVYSVLHVRNGWLHFLEFVFYNFRSASDLCGLTASIVERVVRRVAVHRGAGAIQETSEFMWDNLSQMAAIVSLVPTLVAQHPEEQQRQQSGTTVLSAGQRRILCRKAYELWTLVLPRLHLINWDELKSELLLNAGFSDDLPMEDKEIFCFVVAESSDARLLALDTVLQHLQFAQNAKESNAGLVASLKKTLETLRLVAMPAVARHPTTSPSSAASSSTGGGSSGHHHRSSFSPPPTGGIAEAFALYVADAVAFFGEPRCVVSCVPRELVQLHTLDALYNLLVDELDGPAADQQCFRTVFSLVEIVIALASAALRLQSRSSGDEEATSVSTPAEVTKTMQIIASTDLSFFVDLGQLQQLLALWRLHRDIHTVFSNVALMEKEVKHSHEPFVRRWTHLLDDQSSDFNPYLLHKDATIQADVLVKEVAACEEVWRGLLDETEAADGALFETAQEDEKGLPSSLKQDAEKFASSVHKLIVHSSRENRLSTVEHSASSQEIATENTSCTSSVGGGSCRPDSLMSLPSGDGVLWKVNMRENGLRMRLRLKQVRDNYRLRNLSCEYAEVFQEDDPQTRNAAANAVRLGPRRFKSARDNIGNAPDGGEFDKSWRSDAGSDYSDFLADAQMRAAIVRTCPSVNSDRDSFHGDLSSDELDDDDVDMDDDDDQELLKADSDDSTTEAQAAAAFDQEAQELLVMTESAPVEPTPPPVPVMRQPPVASPSLEPRSSPVSSPSSPLGTFSGFGASLLSVVGGVTEMVSKVAKDAKDAVELGVDSLYTARDALADDAQTLVHEVGASLADVKPAAAAGGGGSSPLGSRSANQTNDSRRPSVTIATDPPLVSSSSPRDSGPVLFPPSPPVREVATAKSKAATTGRQPTATQTRRGSFGSGSNSSSNGNSSSSKRELEFEANLVRHMHVVAGKLVLTETDLWFLAERVIDEHETVLAERKKGVPIHAAWRFLFKRRRWKIDDIASVNRRRYLLKPTALEFFIHSTRKNYFFSLAMDDIVRFHESLLARRPVILRRDPTMRRLRHPSSIFRNSNMSVRWMNHELSTFEYLMWLNTIAGRTYNDLTQYPVFPWVIADYESPSLDLSRAATFRDLTKPMGALEPSRLKFYLDRYHAFEDSDIPKFMYGTHYSNIGVVLYYLIRLEPFTSYALSVQGGKFDHADRLFHSIAETWNNCLHDFNDVKELTPEWFYLPQFLTNCNTLELGAKQSGVPLGDVVLPPWASSPEDFVLKNFMALESEYVSQHIHKWIDLIFGATQRGQAAVDASNVFFYLTYEGMVDVDAITDQVTKSSMRAQIAHFGQTPTQVLREPHPSRLRPVAAVPTRRTSTTTPRTSSSCGPEPASSPPKASSPLSTSLAGSAALHVPPLLSDGRMTLLHVPHDHAVVLLHLVPGASSMLCVDNHGQMSMHRYGTKSVKVHHTPFMNDLSSTATKASGVFKASPSNSSSSSHATAVAPSPGGTSSSGATNHDCGGGTSEANTTATTTTTSTEYMEVHDRKSRKIVGDKRLVALDATSTRIAFLNSGAVYCSVGHHDFSARFHSSTDGALLYRLLQHNAVVKCVGTSSNGSLLALGSCDGTISVWKVAHIASTLLDSIKIFRAAKSASRPVHANDYAADQVLLGHAASVNCVIVSDDLGICVSGSMANECLAHDLADGSILQQYVIPGSDAPGVVSLALSPVGHVVVQSLGLRGVPMLYVFHLNGTLLAKTALEDGVMTTLSICTRFSKVIVSNNDVALSYAAHSLQDKQVLLDKRDHGPICSHALSPDETHVVFGVGIGKLVSLSLVARTSSSSSASTSASSPSNALSSV